MKTLYESLLDTEKVLKKNDLNIFNNLYDNMDSPYRFKQAFNEIIENLKLTKTSILSTGGRINVSRSGPGLYMAYHERHGLLSIGFIQDLNDMYSKDPKSMAIQFLPEPRRVIVTKQDNMKQLFIGYSIYKLPEIYHDIYIDFYKKKLKNIHESLLDDEDEILSKDTLKLSDLITSLMKSKSENEFEKHKENLKLKLLSITDEITCKKVRASWKYDENDFAIIIDNEKPSVYFGWCGSTDKSSNRKEWCKTKTNVLGYVSRGMKTLFEEMRYYNKPWSAFIVPKQHYNDLAKIADKYFIIYTRD